MYKKPCIAKVEKGFHVIVSIYRKKLILRIEIKLPSVFLSFLWIITCLKHSRVSCCLVRKDVSFVSRYLGSPESHLFYSLKPHPHVAYSNRFRPSTHKGENDGDTTACLTVHALWAGVLKKRHSGIVFWCPKTPFTCGRKAKTEEKIFIFKNIRIRAFLSKFLRGFLQWPAMLIMLWNNN